MISLQRKSSASSIANGGTGSSTAGGALTNLGAQPVDADLTSIAGVATTGILVRTGVDTYNTRLIAGTANEITVTNGDGVAGNPTISIPTAVTFTGKTVTGGTFTGSTLSGVTTKTGTMVNTANTAAAVAPTALGAPLAAFVNTWEKVEISNNGTGGTAYVSLPAGTDGRKYARFRYSWTAGANAVVVQPGTMQQLLPLHSVVALWVQSLPTWSTLGTNPLGYPVSNQQSVISKESSK
ncbi:MAG: hypothetical protein IPI29_00040 [Ignavibacteria bacterium]|nr:hypothetical protein [Ignavibacteria bacterium]